MFDSTAPVIPAPILAAKPFWAHRIDVDEEYDGTICAGYRANYGAIYIGLEVSFDGHTVDFMDGHIPEVWLPDHSDTMTAQELHDLAIDAVTVESILARIEAE